MISLLCPPAHVSLNTGLNKTIFNECNVVSFALVSNIEGESKGASRPGLYLISLEPIRICCDFQNRVRYNS